jgi:GT2 family glycosyltransferase
MADLPIPMNTPPRHIPDDLLPGIAIGVLGYNRCDEVIVALHLLREIDYPPDRVKLIVIDNGSSDGTRDRVLEAFQGEVEVLRLPVNIGAVARNRVMMTRQEPYNFVFDEDSAPERPDTIRRIVEFMEANPYFGALCFRSINFYSGTTEYGEFAELSSRRLPDGSCEGMYVIGNGMCFRRTAIQRTDGYDERLFWGAEEFELALELLYHDVPVAFHPDFALIHRHAQRAFTPAGATQLFLRNNIWIAFKFFPFPIAVGVASLLTLRPLLTGIVKKKPGVPMAVLQGAWEGLRTLDQIFPTRKSIPVGKLARHSRWFFHMFYTVNSRKSTMIARRRTLDARSVETMREKVKSKRYEV